MDYLKSLNIEQKMNIPPQADLLGFILVEQNSKVPVSRIVLNNQGPTFIYMTSKQMKSLLTEIFLFVLIFN